MVETTARAVGRAGPSGSKSARWQVRLESERQAPPDSVPPFRSSGRQKRVAAERGPGRAARGEPE